MTINGNLISYQYHINTVICMTVWLCHCVLPVKLFITCVATQYSQHNPPYNLADPSVYSDYSSIPWIDMDDILGSINTEWNHSETNASSQKTNQSKYQPSQHPTPILNHSSNLMFMCLRVEISNNTSCSMPQTILG